MAEPDRPIECSECKKNIKIHYTEIIGENSVLFTMCEECPVLQQKLHGTKSSETSPLEWTKEKNTGLCCGNCETTLESIRMGSPVGCEECYEVFSDVLIQDLVAFNRISQKTSAEKSSKSAVMHVGRSPGEAAELNPSLRLIALNEALNEVLSKEDYEQAAWLRDQIKELEETIEPDEASHGKE